MTGNNDSKEESVTPNKMDMERDEAKDPLPTPLARRRAQSFFGQATIDLDGLSWPSTYLCITRQESQLIE